MTDIEETSKSAGPGLPVEAPVGPLIYQSGEPKVPGVYACRVPDSDIPGLLRDRFLIWHMGRWGYLGSDQRWRGEVPYWIGPLPRRLPNASLSRAHAADETNSTDDSRKA